MSLHFSLNENIVSSIKKLAHRVKSEDDEIGRYIKEKVSGLESWQRKIFVTMFKNFSKPIEGQVLLFDILKGWKDLISRNERRWLSNLKIDYGLTRDELRYILDPKDVYGPDFPGETFRILKEKEEKQQE